MSRFENFCSLREDNPFFLIFNGLVPIKGVFAQREVRLAGENSHRAYFADWKKFTAEQQQATSELMATLRGGTAEEFLAYMRAGGELPVRVSQTTGASTNFPLH